MLPLTVRQIAGIELVEFAAHTIQPTVATGEPALQHFSDRFLEALVSNYNGGAYPTIHYFLTRHRGVASIGHASILASGKTLPSGCHPADTLFCALSNA